MFQGSWHRLLEEYAFIVHLVFSTIIVMLKDRHVALSYSACFRARVYSLAHDYASASLESDALRLVGWLPGQQLQYDAKLASSLPCSKCSVMVVWCVSCWP